MSSRPVAHRHFWIRYLVSQSGTFVFGEPYLMTWPFERDEAQEISVRPFKNLTDS
jgi:hypothetical protein